MRHAYSVIPAGTPPATLFFSSRRPQSLVILKLSAYTKPIQSLRNPNPKGAVPFARALPSQTGECGCSHLAAARG